MIERRDGKLSVESLALKRSKGEISGKSAELDSMRDLVANMEAELEGKEAALELKASEINAMARDIATLQLKRSEALSSMSRLKGLLGGRKPLQRSDAQLKGYEKSGVAAHARNAMTERINACVGKHGEEGAAAVTAVTQALKDSGFLPHVLESKEGWASRMSWLSRCWCPRSSSSAP